MSLTQLQVLARSYYWRARYALRRLIIYRDYLKLLAMRSLGRSSEGRVNLAGFVVHFSDLHQLIQLFREIFVKRVYYCQLGRAPTIIDAGANIGIATLFFKSQYPHATIIAFEPDPDAFQYLRRNIALNRLTGVHPHHAALGDRDGTVTLYSSSSMARGDIGASAIRQHVTYFHNSGQILERTVRCERLSAYVDREIDLLKLDVEGSEARVLTELGQLLTLVRQVVMEYHYHFTYRDNPLSAIVSAMEQCGHVYKIVGERGSMHAVSSEETYLLRSAREPSTPPVPRPLP
jgi:FkbM family methyltransferase